MFNALVLTLLVLTAVSYVASSHTVCAQIDGALAGTINPEAMKPFVKIGKGYYLVECTHSVNWFEAAEACRRHNAQLVSIETAEEAHDLTQYLISRKFTNKDWFWLGGSDLSKHGRYTWIGTGQCFTHTDWSPGQPDKAGKERCIHYWHSSKWGWNNSDCQANLYYICEANIPKTFSCSVF